MPKAIRARVCASFSDCLEGTLEGDGVWSELLESFTKLVMYGMPAGVSPLVEFEQRLAHWEAKEFAALLTRIQLQCVAKQKEVQRQSAACSRKMLNGRRAKRIAREGAKAKALQSLQGGVRQSTADEQRDYAAKLLPRSERAPAQRPAGSDQRDHPPNTLGGSSSRFLEYPLR